MKIISTFFGFLILVFVLCFALPNQLQVNLGLWPFAGSLQAPLYLVGLAPLAGGFLIGGLLGWLGSIPHRLRARRLAKELLALNERLSEVQKTSLLPPHTSNLKSSFWKRSL